MEQNLKLSIHTHFCMNSVVFTVCCVSVPLMQSMYTVLIFCILVLSAHCTGVDM